MREKYLIRLVIHVVLVTASVISVGTAAADSETCYLNTTSGYRHIGGAATLGPYPSRSSCESVNAQAFQGGGSCECYTTRTDYKSEYRLTRARVADVLNNNQIQGAAKQDLLRIVSRLPNENDIDSGPASSAALERLATFLQSWARSYDISTTRLQNIYGDIRAQIDREQQAVNSLRSGMPRPPTAAEESEYEELKKKIHSTQDVLTTVQRRLAELDKSANAHAATACRVSYYCKDKFSWNSDSRPSLPYSVTSEIDQYVAQRKTQTPAVTPTRSIAVLTEKPGESEHREWAMPGDPSFTLVPATSVGDLPALAGLTANAVVRYHELRPRVENAVSESRRVERDLRDTWRDYQVSSSHEIAIRTGIPRARVDLYSLETKVQIALFEAPWRVARDSWWTFLDKKFEAMSMELAALPRRAQASWSGRAEFMKAEVAVADFAKDEFQFIGRVPEGVAYGSPQDLERLRNIMRDRLCDFILDLGTGTLPVWDKLKYLYPPEGRYICPR